MTAQPTERTPASTATTAAKARAAKAAGGYTARHLSVLEGLEAVRKRPGMYIGSTDSPRAHALPVGDHRQRRRRGARPGTATAIEVVLHADGSVEVRDDGRGIPVDVEPKTGLTGVEVVFTKLHAGGKFGGGSYAASGGLHGVGASVVNALSARLDVEVDRDGKTHAMRSAAACPACSTATGPDARRSPRRSGLRRRGQGAKKGVTGTRVRYWADRQIFLKDAELRPRRAARPRPADRLPRARA